MNIFKRVSCIVIVVTTFSCNDPNVVGLELPGSARFTISNDSIQNFETSTISEDSLRSDESLYLLLGQICDGFFGTNNGGFITQMLLPSNNINEISNFIIDSVKITYSYTEFYGDLNESGDLNIMVYELEEDIYKDSVYYSNFVPQKSRENISTGYKIYEGDSSQSSYIDINIKNSFGEYLLDQTGTNNMVDNEAFLDFFKGLVVQATASNTMLYLNPNADKSRFSIYYHEIGVDTAVSFDFDLGGNSARINQFNSKDSSFINMELGKEYLQSMAGHKMKFKFLQLDSLKSQFSNKAINKVSINFECIEDINYPPHEKVYLVREKSDGKIVFLKDFTIEGDQYFGGELEGNTYSFNITRYFVQLLRNEEYTDVLYLLSSGGSANANRTIIDNNKTRINIIYTEI